MSLPIEGGMLHSGTFAQTLLVNISLDCFPGTNALAYFAAASGTNIFLIILFKLESMLLNFFGVVLIIIFCKLGRFIIEQFFFIAHKCSSIQKCE